MTARPCGRCGDVIAAGSYCGECQPADTKLPADARGYDAAWNRLSRRARRLQRFCSDCGATTDLQTDHSPEAWQRKARGLSIRLTDVDVVCGPCNRSRGRAKPLNWGDSPSTSGPRPEGKAEFASEVRS